ncbi:MAG: DUF3667 domain-containing protein [Proteobacteria bacterium]|uniref:DUF3667 domain-containing protein n=1 Tax=Rudaea sp. TaxID=2136325 RepID=UPI003784077A|nr:DUF3667 domain-containing protein [Pseudomonadota bacterium]
MTTPAADQAPLDPLPPVPLMPPGATPHDAEFSARGEAATAPVQATCANCGTTLLGPHCYACGQPVKGMVRHLSSILADAADTILNIDSRIFRTLWPLYFRPGYLTNEYFEGRRVRYVTPFRLYFFLSILAFFLMQFAIGDANFGNSPQEDVVDTIGKATTVEDVAKQRDAAIAGLRKADSTAPVGGEKGIEKATKRIEKKAEKRLEYLKKVEDAKARGESAPPDPDSDGLNFEIAGRTWDPKTNPVHIGGPKFLDDKANQLLEHAKENLGKLGKDPRPLVTGAISVLPQVLFVLMPLFALLLKIVYVFKRRLYMEHIIVALHSHAFIFQSLFLLVLVGLARAWAQGAAPWLVGWLNLLLFLMGWWLPIYLFLMQKRVYRQGWFMTTLKFGFIGTCYTVLIAFCAAAAFLVSLATV